MRPHKNLEGRNYDPVTHPSTNRPRFCLTFRFFLCRLCSSLFVFVGSGTISEVPLKPHMPSPGACYPI